MSSTPLEPLKAQELPAPPVPNELVRNRGVIAWSSFFFALLQSICGAIVAINGLRLAIGIGSLALSTGAGAAMVRFHADSIRVPMIVIALLGSLLNLAILMHVRHLRNRPAAQWRQKPLSVRQKRSRARPTGSISGYTRSSWRRRVPASQPAPLALALTVGRSLILSHFLIEPRMQTLTEADRQFEDQVVGRQDEDIAR